MLVGGSLNVVAAGSGGGGGKFSAENGYGVEVEEDIDVVARKVALKGALLESDSRSREASVGLADPVQLEVGRRSASARGARYVNQRTSVGGKFNIRAESATLDAANVDAGAGVVVQKVI